MTDSSAPRRAAVAVVRDPRLLPYFLTTREAAQLARKRPRTIGEWCRNGTLTRGVHFTEPAGERLFLRDALLAFLEERDRQVDPAPAARVGSRLNPQASPALASALAREEDRRRHGV